MLMATGRNRRDNGVSTDAAAAGTSLRIRNRLRSQPTAPALSRSAETPNSAAPRPARSQAVRALGTRGGRVGHHHDLSGALPPGVGWPPPPCCPARVVMIQLPAPSA